MSTDKTIFLADQTYHNAPTNISGGTVTLFGEPFYCIRHYDAMPPFFITLVSSSDHWLFIATTGGLTAGRKNADHALFPYYTADRITENHENTGSKSLLRVSRQGRTVLWEPFSEHYRGIYRIERNLYKNVSGTALIFEEINHDLALRFRYAWRTSQEFGLVKTSWLDNHGATACTVEVLDGLQNLLPAHVTAQAQAEFSVLLDAYKRCELDTTTGLGLFALSSRLTDLAEPSESLRANTIWQTGLDNVTHLLSSQQLDAFRSGGGIQPETDIRGRRGAYFAHAAFDLAPDGGRTWHLVCEIDQDSVAVANLIRTLATEPTTLYDRVERDICASQHKLTVIVGSADGLQMTGDELSAAHHFANVLFNVMRGGIFVDQYHVDKDDLREFVAIHRPILLSEQSAFFATLPPVIAVNELKAHAEKTGSPDLVRLCSTYLPLTFSRRHGDPSRPWNRFSINIKKADGSPQLNYEGNWRDIFQNWEALAFAYPEYLEGMIGVFLNATTVDGYNPYRVTRGGIDWEVPQPNNPWANIGYWSDHQIIYLQKLLEAYAQFYPGKLEMLLMHPQFTYANVPYRIKPYADLVRDPYASIEFDWNRHRRIESLVREHGADGRLVMNDDGSVITATLAEKLLNLLLAKLVNFVPGGGIWMNTQRPEWNDANNALVGKGISVVTLGYLLRFVSFYRALLSNSGVDTLPLSAEIATLLDAIRQTLTDHYACMTGDITDQQRRMVMDELGQAGSAYRARCYERGFSGDVTHVPTGELVAFLTCAQEIIGHTLRANQRPDKLYHAYNVLQLSDETARIKHLYEMLEGQVSILSSGLLTPDEALELLSQLRRSVLYRADQHSYILYPDRDLPGFLQKNAIDGVAVRNLALVAALTADDDGSLIRADDNGVFHFSGDIRNARDVRQALARLAEQPRYAELVADSDAILALFEDTFNHDAFTGRSGSFFAYEGLGSIYWHMVSKLLLAVQENIWLAGETHAAAPTLQTLIDVYYDIRAGLGFNKTPDVYGAFPTDPYSHTPGEQGAKQPGMTGMVKEEILTRLGELGLRIEQGGIAFDPVLLRPTELLSESSVLRYFDVDGLETALEVPANALAFTFCQVPIIVQVASEARIDLTLRDGSTQSINGCALSPEVSQRIFLREGTIRQIVASVPPKIHQIQII